MLFPHTFRLFWYITCYILLYLIHPALNLLIENMDKRKHLFVVMLSSSIFIAYNFIVHWYFSNAMVSWVVLYFLISYVKKYLPETRRNTAINTLLFLCGSFGSVLILFILNTLGTHVYRFESISISYFDDVSIWNPFHIMISLALLNRALAKKEKNNRLINEFSSLSLLMFVVHSNRIVRCYCIPTIWQLIFLRGGYRHIVLYAYIFGGALFLVSLIVSIIYKQTVHKLIERVAKRAVFICAGVYRHLENRLVEIN